MIGIFKYCDGEAPLLNLVPIHKLKEGWILSEDVRDINGRLMLSKGNVIESKHLRIFKIWGIAQVGVTQPEAALNDDIRQDETPKLQRFEQIVSMVMQNIDLGHPLTGEIFRKAVHYRYRHKLSEGLNVLRPLPENFNLDLSGGLKTQIEFSDIKLPEAPDIILDYNKVLENPHSSVNDIADVVNRSPSLTAFLLKITNSAYYGFPSKIDTVTRAVSLIGTREVSSLILGISVMSHFHSISKELADMSKFLRHSLSCGILARIVAAQLEMQYTEQFFIAGLLHDIGRLVWYNYFPEQAKLLLQLAQKTGRSLYEVEKKCMGISHEQIAGYLLNKWKFPLALENSIVYHHSPLDSPDPVAAGIIHIADIAVNALGLGHSGERILPHFESQALDKIGIDPSVLNTAIDQTTHQLDIMETLFSEL